MAIVLIVALLATFTYWMVWVPERMGFGHARGPGDWFDLIWLVACVLASLQFFLPAFFAFGYLQRLKGVLEKIETCRKEPEK